jgi:hypothetical protein
MKFHVYMLLSGFTCETCVLVSNAIDFTLLTASHVFARPSLTLLVTSGISFLNVYCHLLLPQCSPGYVSPREASQRPRAVEPRRAGILQEPPPTTPTPTQYPPPTNPNDLQSRFPASQSSLPSPAATLSPCSPPRHRLSLSPPIPFYLSACSHCSSPVTAPPRSPPLPRRCRRTACSSKIQI